MNATVGTVEELDIDSANKYLKEFHKNKQNYFIDRLLGKIDDIGHQKLGWARQNMQAVLILKGASKLANEICIVMKSQSDVSSYKYMIIDFCRSGSITDGMKIFESSNMVEIKKYFKEHLFIFEGICDETDARLKPRTDFIELLDKIATLGAGDLKNDKSITTM